jgi:hypothetical protein
VQQPVQNRRGDDRITENRVLSCHDLVREASRRAGIANFSQILLVPSCNQKTTALPGFRSGDATVDIVARL